jgi:uncharacterized protein YlxP (DUF503 family)
MSLQTELQLRKCNSKKTKRVIVKKLLKYSVSYFRWVSFKEPRKTARLICLNSPLKFW